MGLPGYFYYSIGGVLGVVLLAMVVGGYLVYRDRLGREVIDEEHGSGGKQGARRGSSRRSAASAERRKKRGSRAGTGLSSSRAAGSRKKKHSRGGSSGRGGGGAAGGSSAALLEDMSAKDAKDTELLETFLNVMKSGISLNVFTKAGKKRPVFLHIDNHHMLRWRFSSGSFGQRKFRLDLHNVRSAASGKTTELLQSVATANEEFCFSLILLDGAAVDFEAASSIERDALVQGFTIHLQDLETRDMDDEV